MTTQNIDMTIAQINFDDPDFSVYNLVHQTTGNGLLTFERNISKSGLALESVSSPGNKAYLYWEVKDPTQFPTFWKNQLNFSFDLYLKSNPQPYMLPFLKFYLSNGTMQWYYRNSSVYLVNSSDSAKMAPSFKLDQWHHIEIRMFMQNGTVQVWWDGRFRFAQKEPNIRSISAISLGDTPSPTGDFIVDNFKLDAIFPVPTAKPIYYTYIIMIDGNAIDPVKLLQLAHEKGPNITYSILVSPDMMGSATVVAAIKNLKSLQPSTAIGLRLGEGSYSLSYIDQAFQNFRSVFGFYPDIAGGYTTQYALAEVARKYNTKAILAVVGDGNGFSQFWNYPYFISNGSEVVSSYGSPKDVVGFQWASSHPLWYLTDSADWLTTSDWASGMYLSSQARQFQYLDYELNNTKYNDFGYVTSGIETHIWGDLNTTLELHNFNWTTAVFNDLVTRYPFIQSKSLKDVANILISNYNETPLYTLYYPNFWNATKQEKVWILEGAGYRSMLYWNNTHFGLVDLEVFGNTSAHHIDSTGWATFNDTYPAIVESRGMPFHGITLSSFNPTSVSVIKSEGGDPDFTEVKATNGKIEWDMEFFGKSLRQMSFLIRTAQSGTDLNVQATASRKYTINIPSQIINYDWGALFNLAGNKYSWDNLPSSCSGKNVEMGFNLSSVFISNYNGAAAIIRKGSDTYTSYVNISYPIQSSESMMTLSFGNTTDTLQQPVAPYIAFVSNVSSLDNYKPSASTLSVSVAPNANSAAYLYIYSGNLLPLSVSLNQNPVAESSSETALASSSKSGWYYDQAKGMVIISIAMGRTAESVSVAFSQTSYANRTTNMTVTCSPAGPIDIPNPAPDAYCAAAWNYSASLGGWSPSPVAIQWVGDRLIAIARGANNEVWAKEWNGVNLTGWYIVNSGSTNAPPKLVTQSGRVYLYVQGLNGDVSRSYYIGQGNWSPWEDTLRNNSQFGVVGPSAVDTSGNTYNVFISSNGIDLYACGIPGAAPNATCTGSWQLAADLNGATPSGSISAVQFFNGRIITVIRGVTNQIWANEWNGTEITGWYVLPGSTSHSPKLAVQNANLWLYVKGDSGDIFRSRYQGQANWTKWEDTKFPVSDFGLPGPSAVQTSLDSNSAFEVTGSNDLILNRCVT